MKAFHSGHDLLTMNQKTRIDNRLPVAREGIPFILCSLIATLILLFFDLWILSIPACLIFLFIIYFFRDPERENNAIKNSILSPADGRILKVENINDNENPLGEPAVRASIFMSVFNVHVNRIPISGRITDIVYNKGSFLSANLDKASEQNENNMLVLETSEGKRIVFIQIAGLIARRIACWIKKQDYVEAGQRFGLIRFGSRLDIYIPQDTEVITRPRDKVKAAVTVIGYLNENNRR